MVDTGVAVTTHPLALPEETKSALVIPVAVSARSKSNTTVRSPYGLGCGLKVPAGAVVSITVIADNEDIVCEEMRP